jgi:1,2-diacylglycerol 3-beta-glucosyltransferase
MDFLTLLLNAGRIAILVVEGALVVEVGYLLLLTVAAVFAPRRTPARAGAPTHRFAVLVPAHDEELLIERTVRCLLQMDYPRELYAVHVIADNCSDRTAELARNAGAVVHERVDEARRGKGYALDWALQRLWEGSDHPDAVVIVDADTDVSRNFLAVMDARVERGEHAVQAYYAVRDPARSWGAALRYVALAVLHYLRPQGRMTLGGSAGLKGNGMMFTAGVMRRLHWSAALTEDIELHMNLLLAGERVTFAPDAVVWAEMPDTLANAQSQNARWERGRLQMLRTYGPALLRQALARRRFALLDAVIEQLIPPTSVLAFLNVACLAGAFLFGMQGGAILAAALLACLALYVLAGLLFARAPWRVYGALLYAPLLMIWKVWLYARVLVTPGRQEWVRTARNQESRTAGR